MSTVNSMHSLNSLAETLSPESGTKPEILDYGSISISTPEIVRPVASRSQQRESSSPTLLFDAYALVAENRLVGQEDASKQQLSNVLTMTMGVEKDKR